MATTDYRSSAETNGTEKVSEIAREVSDRAVSLTEDLAATVREHPYTALAVAAGLAFAVGALWKLGQPRQQNPLEGLLGRLPEFPGKDSLPARWR